MTSIRFHSIPTDVVRDLQAGGVDANGQVPERHTSIGDGVPCRHCQTDVGKGEDFLILGYCPFPAPQPFAETGPIFLHADPCPAYKADAGVPDMFFDRESYLLKGYGTDDRIVYGTGRIVAPGEIAAAASEIFERSDVAYIHTRSALNNCYQCTLKRA